MYRFLSFIVNCKLNKIYIVINLFVVFNICIFYLFNKNIAKPFYHLLTVPIAICLFEQIYQG